MFLDFIWDIFYTLAMIPLNIMIRVMPLFTDNYNAVSFVVGLLPKANALIPIYDIIYFGMSALGFKMALMSIKLVSWILHKVRVLG